MYYPVVSGFDDDEPIIFVLDFNGSDVMSGGEDVFSPDGPHIELKWTDKIEYEGDWELYGEYVNYYPNNVCKTLNEANRKIIEMLYAY